MWAFFLNLEILRQVITNKQKKKGGKDVRIFCKYTKWSCTDKWIVVYVNIRYKNVLNKIFVFFLEIWINHFLFLTTKAITIIHWKRLLIKRVSKIKKKQDLITLFDPLHNLLWFIHSYVWFKIQASWFLILSSTCSHIKLPSGFSFGFFCLHYNWTFYIDCTLNSFIFGTILKYTCHC